MHKEGQYAFISYSSKNQQMADSVRLLFQEKGIPCWMAPYDIPAGSKYAFVINDALEKCACLVLLLTNASQESQFVEREIERAITYRKPIIPMQLEHLQLNSGFKFYIGNSQIIAVPEIRADAPEFLKVLEGIRKFVGYAEPEKQENEEQKLPAIVVRAMQCNKIAEHWTVESVTESTATYGHLRIHDPKRATVQCDLSVNTILREPGNKACLNPEEQQAYSRELEEKKNAITKMLTVPECLRHHRHMACPLEVLFHDWEEEDAFGCDLLIRYEALTSLRQQLEEGKTFTEDEIVAIGQVMAEVISAFHENEIRSSIISAESICVNRYGAYKLLGFPLPDSERIRIPDKNAASGMGQKSDDIYSLGLVLRQLSGSGKQLFDAVADIWAEKTENQRPSPGLSRVLTVILNKACSPQPENRYCTAEEFCTALKNIHRQEHRTPSILQRDLQECGAASLAMIFAYWGKNFSLDQLCAETNVSPDGCNAGDIMRAAKRFGMDCHGYRKKPEALAALPMPCILHWSFCHFLVLEDIHDGVAYLNDPASGHKEITMEELDKHFTGVVLTFAPTENW